MKNNKTTAKTLVALSLLGLSKQTPSPVFDVATFPLFTIPDTIANNAAALALAFTSVGSAPASTGGVGGYECIRQGMLWAPPMMQNGSTTETQLTGY